MTILPQIKREKNSQSLNCSQRNTTSLYDDDENDNDHIATNKTRKKITKFKLFTKKYNII